MKKVKIEGIATISDRGFHFDSGLPSNEPVLEQPVHLHGTLCVSKNGCADLDARERVYLPPQMHSIAEGVGYKLKRTSRHYLILMKVPVVESRQETQETIDQIVPTVMGEITLDRKELLDPLQLPLEGRIV